MISFIPAELYTYVFYYLLLALSLVIYSRSLTVEIDSESNIKVISVLNKVLLAFVVLFMGLRPFSKHFGDMVIYAQTFLDYKSGERMHDAKDYLFDFYLIWTSEFLSVEMFMLLCALLYVGFLWVACKKIFREYAFYAFFALVVSFSFWAYGTNGIRNGIATSLFVFALTRDRLFIKILLILAAVGFHKSMFLPAGAYLLTLVFKNPKHYFRAWFAAIPLSLVAGGFWERLFADFMEDERTAAYLTQQVETTGFRWDFLLYSASAVYAAYYYIYKKEYRDPLYLTLVNIYLAANAFWILVIRANFSNRFAYLSWFLIALVIFYPLLKVKIVHNQHRVLANILLAYFAFTFLMNVILT